jgi:hypothetical protein
MSCVPVLPEQNLFLSVLSSLGNHGLRRSVGTPLPVCCLPALPFPQFLSLHHCPGVSLLRYALLQPCVAVTRCCVVFLFLPEPVHLGVWSSSSFLRSYSSTSSRSGPVTIMLLCAICCTCPGLACHSFPFPWMPCLVTCERGRVDSLINCPVVWFPVLFQFFHVFSLLWCTLDLILFPSHFVIPVSQLVDLARCFPLTRQSPCG